MLVTSYNLVNMALYATNPVIKAFEVKLYLIVFAGFSAFMALLIYNASLDFIVSEDLNQTPSHLNYQVRLEIALEDESSSSEVKE